MTQHTKGRLAFRASLLVLCLAAVPAWAQTTGGILKVYHRDSPPSASIHEEATISTLIPFMAVFNNLVMYKQDEPQNSLDSVVPDLASEWNWDDSGTKLTFKLRDGVTWHDGKSFTSADVKCTWDMLTGKGEDKLRRNPRRSWYNNLEEVTVQGEHEVTFHLKRPQPALLALLASGFSPVYPCHVPQAEMRRHPIGTGPFKFVEMSQNRLVRLTKNENYWKKNRPYLDGIEYTVIKTRATAILAFIAGNFHLTFPGEVSVPLLKDVKSQAPQAVCELRPTNVSNNILINFTVPPFNNPDAVRALMLAIDRKSFIDILFEGEATIGGTMLPPPEGVWGLPQEYLEPIPGYTGDVEENREEARRIMRDLGYGPDNRLKLKMSVRNTALFRDPAVVMIGQLHEIYIDAEMELVETAVWTPKIMRGDFTISTTLMGNGVDDPDQNFYENYTCDAERNLTGYCNPELDKLIDQQSMEPDQEKRKELVWKIDQKLQLDGVRPMISHYRAATCWQPELKGLTTMVNSLYNGWRFEDVWLDR